MKILSSKMFQLSPIRPAGLGLTVSINFRSFTPDPTLRFQKFLRPSEKLLSMTIDRPGETWLQKEITPVWISSIISLLLSLLVVSLLWILSIELWMRILNLMFRAKCKFLCPSFRHHFSNYSFNIIIFLCSLDYFI